jgi:hypothetical protein
MTVTPVGATSDVGSGSGSGGGGGGVVVAGVDTHADTIHVAVLDCVGRALGDRDFPTTPAGYTAALPFVAGFGTVIGFGVEGTSSYGAGVARTVLSGHAAVAGAAQLSTVRATNAMPK